MYKTKSRVDQHDLVISNNLRAFRLGKIKTQTDIAAIIGVSIQQVQKYELGKNRIPASKLYTLATAFKINVAEFFIDQDGYYKIVNEIPTPNNWIKMLKYYEKLNEAQKKAITELIKAIVEEQDEKVEDESE